MQKNTLANKFPELAKQWCYEKNGLLKPTEVLYGSTKKVWWKCPVAEDHIWQAKVNNRTNGTGCPFCKNKKSSKNYCLKNYNPELMKEWYWDKNIENPENLLPKSNKKVWWKCPVAEDHIWQASPAKRIIMKSGCPFCKGIKVCNSNSLATTHSQLLEFWSSKNKTKITEVTKGMIKKVWWKCNICRKDYYAAICSKVAGHGCPKCKTSLGENRIKNFLQDNDIKFLPQYTFHDCKRIRPLPFDFAIFLKETILVEFQGELHYKKGRFRNAELKLIKIQESDKIKKEYCKNKNIKLFEITYKDVNGVEEILKKIIMENS